MTDIHKRYFEFYSELAELSLVTDSRNPHFKNQYASINAYFDLVKPLAIKHGFMLESIRRRHGTEPMLISVAVQVTDKSGEVVKATEFVVNLDQPLADVGGCLTYGTRYAIRDMFALPTEIDQDAPARSDASATKYTFKRGNNVK
jgi:hypothetical protein